MPSKKGKKFKDGHVFKGESTAKVDAEKFGKELSEFSFDPDFITQKAIEFGKLLTGVQIYDYQYDPIYRIIYSVITIEGAYLTVLFARQSGKSEALAFAIPTIAVLVPVLAKFFPELDQYKDGVKIGLFAPQVDQIQTTYSRTMMRIGSSHAIEVLSDPDIDTALTSEVRFELSNGSFMHGQCASKQSKIESKTYDLVIMEEAQDIDSYIAQKSIEPMVSATSGTIVKVGTTGTAKNHYWFDIQENKRLSRKARNRKLVYHFEQNYKRVIEDKRKQYKIDGRLFHLNYERDIVKKKQRWGEDSDAFKLGYALIWALDTGMFITDTDWNRMCNKKKSFPKQIKSSQLIVAGLDIGKSVDSTVITVMNVFNRENEEGAPCKEIIAWFELLGDNYDDQHNIIMEVLMEYNVRILALDYTGVGRAVGDRLMAEVGDEITVIPYTFSRQSKSEMWLNLMNDIRTGRLIVPAHRSVSETDEFKKFEQQMKSLQKYYEGSYLVAEAIEDEHDDYCLSNDTEILTQRGFLGIDDLNKDDLVATHNKKTNKIEFQHPERVIVKNYNGNMIHLKGEHTEQLVTYNHKLPIERRTKHNERHLWVKDIIMSQELLSISNQTLRSNRRFPISARVSNKGIDLKIEEIEFIAWMITEGWISYYYADGQPKYSIAQSYRTYPWKVKQIKGIIDSLGLSYAITDKEDLGMRFFQFRKESSKYISELLCEGIHTFPNRILYTANYKQLNVFFETLMEADGCWSRMTYSNKSLKYAQDFSILCHLIGQGANIQPIHKAGKLSTYAVYVLKEGYRGIQKIEEVSYNDRVWCVTVPNGFIVTRYNNKISITGNCDSAALGCIAGNSYVEEIEAEDDEFNPFYDERNAEMSMVRFASN